MPRTEEAPCSNKGPEKYGPSSIISRFASPETSASIIKKEEDLYRVRRGFPEKQPVRSTFPPSSLANPIDSEEDTPRCLGRMRTGQTSTLLSPLRRKATPHPRALRKPQARGKGEAHFSYLNSRPMGERHPSDGRPAIRAVTDHNTTAKAISYLTWKWNKRKMDVTSNG
ncbi:hypothetical protein AVEN_87996-1 [Araneus ventricosus]|uniref:Uncharacterized protein n=1 Tax=Araneus ventricosus TaxID=182803 RepID=A0A4Y2FYU1_ARAVE|nr:hypothetical protein AVEN_87996-1 [Araneus ventricosus]